MDIFVVDGNVIVSPNTDMPPSSRLAPALEQNKILIRGDQLRVFNPKYPHLLYFLSPIHSRMLFSCLNYKRDTDQQTQENSIVVIVDIDFIEKL